MSTRIAALLLALTLAPGVTHAGVDPAASPDAPSAVFPACEAYLTSLSLPDEWECLGEADLLAPRENFENPEASRDWELRPTWIVGLRRAGSSQPDQHLYVDQQTHATLYRQRFGPDGTLESAVWVNAL